MKSLLLVSIVLLAACGKLFPQPEPQAVYQQPYVNQPYVNQPYAGQSYQPCQYYQYSYGSYYAGCGQYTGWYWGERLGEHRRR